jgi:hypothetical protein
MSDAGSLNRQVTFELKGETYTFSKMTLGMLGELVSEVGKRRLGRTLEALGPKATVKDKIEVVNALSAQQQAENDFDLIKTVEGLQLALWLSLRPNHPDLTEEAVGQMIEIDRLSEITSFVVAALLGTEAAGDTDEATGTPKN